MGRISESSVHGGGGAMRGSCGEGRIPVKIGCLMAHRPRRRLGGAFAAVSSLLLVQCASPGAFVWISAVPKETASVEYTVQEGDLIEIRVFNQDPLSTHARVRADGRITMPIVGDIEVRGKRPSDIRVELEARLKDYVKEPSVTVSMQEAHPITVSVLGEVNHQGVFPIDIHASLADVLALAGGLNDYASRDRLFVVRTAPSPERIRFTYDDVSRGNPVAVGFALHQGDLIVAE
jgi:polysaccharide export outer membrane protein